MAEKTAKLNFRTDGLNQIPAQAKNAETGVRRLGDASAKTEARLKSIGKSAARGFDAIVKPAAAIFGGLSLAGGIKQAVSLDKTLASLKATAGLTESQVAGLRDRINDLAGATGTLPEDLAGAFLAFRDADGDMGVARDIMGEIAQVAKATGAEINDVATIAANLQGNLKLSKDETLDALAAFQKLGKISDLAGALPAVLKQGRAFGFQGAQGAGQIAGAVGVATGLAGGNEEEGAARIAALLKDLKTSSKQLKKGGVNIFDKAGNVKSFDEIIDAVLKKSKGSQKKLSESFGLSAQSAETLLGFGGAGGISDAARQALAAPGAGSGAQQIRANFEAATTGVGAAAFQLEQAQAKAAAALTGFSTTLTSFAAQNPVLAAGGAVGAAVGGSMLLDAVKSGVGSLVSRLFRGKGAAGSAAAAALGGGEVQQVEVINFPAGFGGGASSVAGGAGSVFTQPLAQVSTAAKAMGALGALAAGFSIGTFLDEKFKWSDSLSDWAVGLMKRSPQAITGEANAGQLEAQARQLGELKSRGVQQITGADGSTSALTEETARAQLTEAATRMGVGSEQLAAMLPQLLEAFRNPTIVVRPAQGVDKLDVSYARGKF